MTAATIVHATVGRYYMVPCLFVPKELRAWIAEEWAPILGNKHIDPELGVDAEHFHIDWRFVREATLKFASAGVIKSPHGKIITNDSGDIFDHKLTGMPVLKRRLCKRAMPEFPSLEGKSSRRIFARMEAGMLERCARLKDGHICPHRGIDLRPFADAEGFATCPGHGLRWNLSTGELVPRFTVGSSQ